MGELAFGESFQMLENAETHWAIELLNGGMEHLALFRKLLLPYVGDKLANHLRQRLSGFSESSRRYHC